MAAIQALQFQPTALQLSLAQTPEQTAATLQLGQADQADVSAALIQLLQAYGGDVQSARAAADVYAVATQAASQAEDQQDTSQLSLAEYQYIKYSRQMALQQQVSLAQQLQAALASVSAAGLTNLAAVATQAAHDPLVRFTGAVRSWDSERCFGFIQCPEAKHIYQKDVFLHQSEILQEADQLKLRQKLQISDGEVVTFRVEIDKGKPRAVSVQFAKADAVAAASPEGAAAETTDDPTAKRRRLL